MIRAMKVEDLPVILEMEKELFSSPWDEKSFLYEINENQFSFNYVIEVDGEIAGYCDLWCLFEQAQITNIGVSKKHQRKHLASQMMGWMIDKAIAEGCETISLEVRYSNTPAIECYKKNGFEQIGIRKGYYQDNHEDARLMMKAIGGMQ